MTRAFALARDAGRRIADSVFVRRDVRAAIVPWVVARVIVVGSLALSRHVYAKIGAPPRPTALRQGLFAWDGAFYRAIAEHGYHSVGRASLRFFPLVPLLARLLGWILLGHTAAALIVVANASALAFGALIHRLVIRETADFAVARRAAWFGAVFPAAAALVLGYAEATAMLLGVVLFLGLRTRHFGWAAAAGLLAGLCRPVGVLLIVPALVEAARDWRTTDARERVVRVSAVAAPAIGASLYLGWVGFEFGDVWLPISLQNRSTLRGGFQDPFTRTIDAFGDLFGGDRFGSGLHIVWALFFAALLVMLVRRAAASYSLYAAATLVLGLSAHNLDSFERYAMSAFPFLIALAMITRREAWERFALVTAGAGLVGYAILAFLGISGP